MVEVQLRPQMHMPVFRPIVSRGRGWGVPPVLRQTTAVHWWIQQPAIPAHALSASNSVARVAATLGYIGFSGCPGQW